MAVTETTRLPAGWYPDPEGGDRRRWWDGREWTQYTAAFQRPTSIDEPDPEPVTTSKKRKPSKVAPAAAATAKTAKAAAATGKTVKAAAENAKDAKAAKPARTVKATKTAAAAKTVKPAKPEKSAPAAKAAKPPATARPARAARSTKGAAAVKPVTSKKVAPPRADTGTKPVKPAKANTNAPRPAKGEPLRRRSAHRLGWWLADVAYFVPRLKKKSGSSHGRRAQRPEA